MDPNKLLNIVLILYCTDIVLIWYNTLYIQLVLACVTLCVHLINSHFPVSIAKLHCLQVKTQLLSPFSSCIKREIISQSVSHRSQMLSRQFTSCSVTEHYKQSSNDHPMKSRWVAHKGAVYVTIKKKTCF